MDLLKSYYLAKTFYEAICNWILTRGNHWFAQSIFLVIKGWFFFSSPGSLLGVEVVGVGEAKQGKGSHHEVAPLCGNI